MRMMMTSIKFLTFLEYVNVKKYNKEWQFASDGFMPLSPSILKKFEKEVKGVYHVTDIKGLQKLARLQGKRVDIATFTKGSRGLSGGLLTTAEVLVTLNGKSSVEFEQDVATKVDRNGIRWLSSHGGVSAKVNGIVYQFGREILPKVIDKFKIPSKKNSQMAIDVHNWVHDKDGKTKQKFLRYFHKEAKKLINQKLIDKINKAISWMEFANINHNEILLHNFKIVNSKLIRSSDPDKAEKMWKKAEEAGMTKFDVIDQVDVEKL